MPKLPRLIALGVVLLCAVALGWQTLIGPANADVSPAVTSQVSADDQQVDADGSASPLSVIMAQNVVGGRRNLPSLEGGTGPSKRTRGGNTGKRIPTSVFVP